MNRYKYNIAIQIKILVRRAAVAHRLRLQQEVPLIRQGGEGGWSYIIRRGNTLPAGASTSGFVPAQSMRNPFSPLPSAYNSSSYPVPKDLQLRLCAINTFRFIENTSSSAPPPLITITSSQVSTAKMVLKLYGSAMSTSRVLVTILEKQLPYELIFIDIAKGEQKSDEYMKLQPFGKVPVLEDDGFFMFESRAICKYLARYFVFLAVACLCV